MSNEQLTIINEKKAAGNFLYSLMPLEDFKAVLGIDDREDKLARFCLVTATFTIEQYCKRRLLRKRHFENIEFFGDLVLPLREYPVSKITAMYAVTGIDKKGEWFGEWIVPYLYRVLPDCCTDLDIPFLIKFSPEVARMGCYAIKAIYWAGYSSDKVPADLAAACLELASWSKGDSHRSTC
jgi:hypothetical protein